MVEVYASIIAGGHKPNPTNPAELEEGVAEDSLPTTTS